jgi:Heparinase II/III-like protein/Heparinase II/III N-terminus
MNPQHLLKKVLSMDRDEIRFRVASSVRREAARLGYAARRPAWHREDLAQMLRPDSPLVGSAITCVQRRDWAGAHDALMQHFATRAPRFALDPQRRSSTAEAVLRGFPEARPGAVARAEALAEGRFDLLGYRNLSFSNGSGGSAIDWHLDPVHGRRAPRVFWSRVPYLDPSSGDHKIVWELNRHQHWMALGRAYWLSGDPRYRDTFVRQLDSWMADNPPLAGMNWASMLELALRSLSWLWALHFFTLDRPSRQGEESSPWTIGLLVGLDRQLTLVQHNLSRYFSPNTHLLGEALALYVAGRTLPELRRAAGWERVGRHVLLDQMTRQIHADGGHAELSAHYHRYTLDFYLLALAIARQTGDAVSGAFADAVRRLARFARVLADDNGRLPAIGDDDGGSLLPICGRHPADVSDSLQLAAHMLGEPALAVGPRAEEVVWLTGDVPELPSVHARWRSEVLPESGYVVSRSSRGDHLTIDAGPHGFLNGGHAHADALAVTLTVRGRPFLIDPGTGCYTIDPDVRDRFRSTQAHNTVTVDGRSQSIPAGPFHWTTRATSSIVEWHAADHFDFFEGVHDGYTPIVHRRTVLARPGCWVVLDRLHGDGLHRADVHWHLEPAWQPTQWTGNAIRADHRDGGTVWILLLDVAPEIVRGAGNSELGWCAPAYGPVIPTATIRATRRAELPFEMVTVIVDSVEPPVLEKLPVAAAGPGDTGHDDSVGFSVRTGSSRETFFFRRSHGGGSEIAWRLARVGDVETDASVLCWREETGREPRPEVVLGGTFAHCRREAVADLEVAAGASSGGNHRAGD